MSGFEQGWRWGEIGAFLGTGVLVFLLGYLPYGETIVYPLRLLGTFVHELSHGFAALATGGDFQRFTVSADLSGLAWSAGGIRVIVSSAGYIGSAVFGGVLVLAATRGVPARGLLGVLGVALAVLCLLFVRNGFGIFSGLVLAAALIAAAWRLRAPWSDGVLMVIALQLILDGYQNLFFLIRISGREHARTDALNMAEATGIPAVVWAVAWALISTAILALVLRWAFKGRGRGATSVTSREVAP